MRHANKSPILAPVLFALAILAGSAAGAASLNLSKALPHYATDMEFYYQKPRPEILPGLIEALTRGQALARGENRLMLAAFLAELALGNGVSLKDLKPHALKAGQDALRCLAWSAHLARDPAEKEFLALLSANGDAILARQISSTPSALSQWNLRSEKTVLQMYWAAFMAAGDTAWIDVVIEAALDYARAKAGGRTNTHDFSVCAAAAASLYELAPRHPPVAARLKKHMRGKSAPELEMLAVILRNVKD